jgi:hypothetical protein
MPFYDMYTNPPGLATVSAGVFEGVPIVYGLAPPGTIDFPVNPNLRVQNVNAAGGFDGVPVSLAGIVTDLESPTVYDLFGGVQYQLSTNLMVHGNYKYRRCYNDISGFNANRFTGDLVDGNLDRLNPNWTSLLMYTNLGKRFYHGLIFGASKRFSGGLQLSANYTYSYGKNNRNYVGDSGENQLYSTAMTEVFQPDLDWSRDDTTHVFHFHNVWDLPILRGRKGWLAGAFGGWQLNTIWFLQSGDPWVIRATGPYGEGGDFNADGEGSERPDLPVGNVPHSFSTRQWLEGTTGLKKDLFPLPPATELRAGTLPRDYFRGPGFWRTDVAFVKSFPVPIGRAEKAQIQLRLEAFNVFNRINLWGGRYGANTNLNSANFARPSSAHDMRIVQLAVKFLF